MSAHYEVVFACFLRGETPGDVLDVLRWHLGLVGELPAGFDPEIHSCPLLSSDPDSYLPGGDSASLRQQVRGRRPDGAEIREWGLFSRNFWLDDDLGSVTVILDLIAPHVCDEGFGGYFREEYEVTPAVFRFREGAAEISSG